MKKIIFFTILSIILFGNLGNAQNHCGLIPISLNERIQNSSLIIEGIVKTQTCQWDDKHNNIYTIYEVEILSILKGATTNSTVLIAAPGGTVGDQQLKVSQTLELENGTLGIFTLMLTNNPISNNQSIYEPYAMAQGFIGYTQKNSIAKGIFDSYITIDKLHKEIKNITRLKLKKIKKITWNQVKNKNITIVNDNLNAVSPLATISSFSPTTITAGTFSQLTINGSGFGASQGASFVGFKNADNGGNTYIAPIQSHYISWSDTQIIVEVPQNAGTGQIIVSTNAISTSNDPVTIQYALFNSNSSISGINKDYLINLINDNGIGGYTWQLNSSFNTDVVARTDFQTAFQQWRCQTGVNWLFGTPTTVNSIASEGINVVRFSIGAELPAGTLGVTYLYFNICSANRYALTEIDMCFNSNINWFYGSSGTPTSSQKDFYSVVLHELGHAQMLGHIIDSSKMMHFSIPNETQKRVISDVESSGAALELSISSVAGSCQNATPHIPNSILSIPTISASGSTSFCQGGSVTLTSSSAIGNTWSNGATTQSINVTSTGNYSVTLTEGICTSAKSSVVAVIVKPLPIVDAGPPTTSFCSNSNATITATTISNLTGFQGIYAPANWTFANSNANGTLNLDFAPESIRLTSGANNSNTSGNTSFSYTFATNTILSFDWNYNTLDGPAFDYPQVLLNGTPTIMQNYNLQGSDTQSGSMTVNIVAGQTFAFNMFTLDNLYTPGTVLISNLVVSDNVTYNWIATNGGSIIGTNTTAQINPGTSGTYTVTATTVNGCSASDSIIVTTTGGLATPTITTSGATTFCAGGNVVLSSSATTGNVWSNGATSQSITVSASGNYSVAVTSGSCTSATSLVRNVIVAVPINNTISISTGVLTANQSAATYQWYLCPNTIITNATNQSYYPNIYGDYKVEITIDSCTVTSICTTFSNLDVTDLSTKLNITIFPNPTQNYLNISTQETLKSINIIDLLGRKTNITNFENNTIDVSNLQNGVYFLEIATEKGSQVQKFIKQ